MDYRNKFIKFVSLNMLGMMGLSIYILADTFFIASVLGTLGIAALNFAIAIYCIVHGLGLMLGMGGATRFAILQGQGKKKEADEAFTHTLVLAVIIISILVCIGLFFSEPVVHMLGAEGEVYEMAHIYIKVTFLSAPCYIFNNILLAFTRNDDNPRLAMIAMLTSSMSNIVLDYIFLYPLNMGMFGAVLATGLAPVISMCVLIIHIKSDKRTYHIVPCSIEIRRLLDVPLLGMSALIGELTSAIALITFNIVILKIAGNTGVAAYGIIANIALVVNAMFVGAAEGVQPLASESYGKGDEKNLRGILKYSIITILLIGMISYGSLYWNADWIVSVFNSEGDKALEMMALEGIIIYFIGYFFAGFNVVFAAYLSAIEKPVYAFVTSMLRSLILLVPLCMLLSSIWGMTGVWCSFVITEALVVVVSWIFLKLTEKK